MDLSLFLFFTLTLHIVLTSLFLRFLWRMKRHESLHNQLVRTQTKKLEQGLYRHQDEMIEAYTQVLAKDLQAMTKRLAAIHENALTDYQQLVNQKIVTFDQRLTEQTKSELAAAADQINSWRKRQIDKYATQLSDILPLIVGKSIAEHVSMEQHHQLVLQSLEQAWNNGEIHEE